MQKDNEPRSDDPWAVDQSVDSDSKKSNSDGGIAKYLRLAKQIPLLGGSFGEISRALFLIPILIIIVVFLFWIYQYNTDFIILPLETSGMETDFNGMRIAELLQYELQVVDWIDLNSNINRLDIIPVLLNATPKTNSEIMQHESKSRSPADRYDNKNRKYTPIEIKGINQYTPIDRHNPPNLGTFGLGGISLSIGDLLLFMRDKIPLIKKPDIISGSLKKFGSTMILEARLENGTDLSSSRTWEIRRNISADSSAFEDEVPSMVAELAFAIASYLGDQHEEPHYRNQETFQNFKNGEKSYCSYLISRNTSDLENAGRLMMLSAKSQHNLDRVNAELIDIAFHLAMEDITNEAEIIFFDCRQYSPQRCDLGLAFAFWREDKYADAIASCDRVLQVEPENVAALIIRGDSLVGSNEFDEGIQEYDNAMKYVNASDYDRCTFNASIFCREGYARRQQNQTEALESLNNSIKLNRNLSDAWYWKGYIHNEQGKYDEANRELNEATKLKQWNGYFWLEKAYALLMLNDSSKDSSKEAIRACNQSIQLNPDNDYFWYYKGWILNELGWYEEANWSLENATKLDPKKGDYWIEKAFSLLKLEKSKEAIRACKQSIQQDPDNAYYWYYKAWILNESGKCEEADQALEEAIRLDAAYESYRDKLICL